MSSLWNKKTTLTKYSRSPNTNLHAQIAQNQKKVYIRTYLPVYRIVDRFICCAVGAVFLFHNDMGSFGDTKTRTYKILLARRPHQNNVLRLDEVGDGEGKMSGW